MNIPREIWVNCIVPQLCPFTLILDDFSSSLSFQKNEEICVHSYALILVKIKPNPYAEIKERSFLIQYKGFKEKASRPKEIDFQEMLMNNPLMEKSKESEITIRKGEPSFKPIIILKGDFAKYVFEVFKIMASSSFDKKLARNQLVELTKKFGFEVSGDFPN